MDANWRWLQHGGTNCYTNDDDWNPAFCSDPKQCALTCSLEGADYAATYGVTSTPFDDGLSLQFVTRGEYSMNYGSRLYLMDSSSTYKIFKLKNREFTFEVDASELVCGLNGAVYFVEMDRHGGYNGHSNTAGAKYGTGYCDAQCPHDIKYIKGEANLLKWNNTHVPPIGYYGACCAEMDIWEANSWATAYTPHTCTEPGTTRCEGAVCGDNEKDQRYDGMCDKDGCDFNSYRLGAKGFYGPGANFTVDSSKPVTVVTQFLTAGETDTGDLVEVKRFYVQDGKVVPNSEATVLGAGGGNAITDDFCEKQKEVFDDLDDFGRKGGMKAMGDALDRGVVLALSLWDDTQVHMLWLDSAYPTDEPVTKPGVSRGPCPGDPYNAPAYLRSTFPTAKVTYRQLKTGTIGSTFASGDGGRRMSAETYV